MFQVCDSRKHQLLEAHVRLYAIMKQTNSEGVSYYETHFLRLQRPDDMIGAPLLLTLPSRVIHRIDAWSALMPSFDELQSLLESDRSFATSRAGKRRVSLKKDSGIFPPGYHFPSNACKFPDPLQRVADAEQGCRNSAVCEVCGDSFLSFACLELHQKFNSATHIRNPAALEQQPQDDKQDRTQSESKAGKSKLNADSSWGEGDKKYDLPDHLIRNHWQKHDIEIVVLVEGVDASTSHLIQARHSYTIDDIEFDREFAPCVFAKDKSGLLVDFTKFHDIIPLSSGSSN
jgi:potassium inwardly-rectifying channel subfamily J